MDAWRGYKNTMDKNLQNETAQADVTETVTTETEAQAEESSSSQDTDYEALIEAERKPDPEKAKEAFKKRQEKRIEHVSETEAGDDEPDEDKPLTRKEMDAYLARRTQEIVAEANAERIQEIATSIAESQGEARYIMEIHKNRVFPEGIFTACIRVFGACTCVYKYFISCSEETSLSKSVCAGFCYGSCCYRVHYAHRTAPRIGVCVTINKYKQV